MKLQAQAYSIRDCHARRLLTKEGDIRQPVIELFAPLWWWTDIIKSGSPQVSCIPRRSEGSEEVGNACICRALERARRTEWSCGEVLVRGWRPELSKASAIKHSSVSQGPFALRCAGFGVNFVAPSETLLELFVFNLAGIPFENG